MLLDDSLKWPRFGEGAYRIEEQPVPGTEQESPFVIAAQIDAARADWYFPGRLDSLFQIFNATPKTPEGVLGFAGRFGLLGGSQERFPSLELLSVEQHPALAEDVTIKPEALTYWYHNIGLVTDVLGLWRASLGDGYHGAQGAGLRETIADRVSGALHARISTILRTSADSNQFEWRFVPNSLIGVIWCQVARCISLNEQWRECNYCGQPFRLQRATALYCSESHRQMAYRKRKEQQS